MNAIALPYNIPANIRKPVVQMSAFVYSTELLVLSDTPFANTAGVAGTPGLEAVILTAYDGTEFRIAAQHNVLDNSAYFADFEFDDTAAEALVKLLAAVAVVEALVPGTIDRSRWPWTITGELYSGPHPDGTAGTCVDQPALRVTRREPIGTDLSHRTTNIISIPESEGYRVVDNFGTIFLPGQEGQAVIAARWGYSRAMIPAVDNARHTVTELVPYVQDPPQVG